MRMCVQKSRKTLQIRQFCFEKHRVSEFFVWLGREVEQVYGTS